ncbi:hypothetical protein D3C71_1001570 [compost metagenome]
MIVPQFWAEGRIQERVAGKQLTVRRYGWSDDSPLAAQAHADQRTREAFDRIVSGETLKRRERRLAYNGADGPGASVLEGSFWQHQREQLAAKVDAEPAESAVAVGLDRGHCQAHVRCDAVLRHTAQ